MRQRQIEVDARTGNTRGEKDTTEILIHCRQYTSTALKDKAGIAIPDKARLRRTVRQHILCDWARLLGKYIWTKSGGAPARSSGGVGFGVILRPRRRRCARAWRARAWRCRRRRTGRVDAEDVLGGDGEDIPCAHLSIMADWRWCGWCVMGGQRRRRGLRPGCDGRRGRGYCGAVGERN